MSRGKTARHPNAGSSWAIPLAVPSYGPEEEEAVLRAMRSGWLTLGPETEALEAEFASMIGVSHAIAVSSGTAALHLALLALGVGPREEVIQPAINSVAAAHMTVAVDADPVFADIVSVECPRVGAQQIEEAWTSRATTVIVTHYGGLACDMRPIQEYCRDQQLHLIEDAWQSLGVESDGHFAGTWGDFGCFSLTSGTDMISGGGGLLVTGRDDLARRVRALRSHGLDQGDRLNGDEITDYDIQTSGFNYCLDEIHAAIARVQLEKLVTLRAKRRDAARLYAAWLGESRGVAIIDRLRSERSACHLMSIVVEPDRRSAIRQACHRRRIETGWHYPCITELSVYRDMTSPRAVQASIEFARRQITLPMHPRLSDGDIKTVCEAVLEGATVSVA